MEEGAQNEGSVKGSADEKQSFATADEDKTSQQSPKEQDDKSRKSSPESEEVPVGPTLDLSSIISETSDILKNYRNFLSDRKTKQAMALYYLRKLSGTLEDYFNFQKKLDNFFSQHEVITAEIYIKHCTTLPGYGDYKKIIKDTGKSIMLPNISSEVTDSDIRIIVVDLTDNVFAGGNYTKTMNKICQNIHSSVVERRGVVHGVSDNFSFWFDLLEKEATNNEKQSDNMFEVLSYILFLNSGINEEPLSLTIPTYADAPKSE